MTLVLVSNGLLVAKVGLLENSLTARGVWQWNGLPWNGRCWTCLHCKVWRKKWMGNCQGCFSCGFPAWVGCFIILGVPSRSIVLRFHEFMIHVKVGLLRNWSFEGISLWRDKIVSLKGDTSIQAGRLSHLIQYVPSMKAEWRLSSMLDGAWGKHPAQVLLVTLPNS